MIDAGRIITFDKTDYDVSLLGGSGRTTLSMLDFVTGRITELENKTAAMQSAKNSYVKSLKQELLIAKAGLVFVEN